MKNFLSIFLVLAAVSVSSGKDKFAGYYVGNLEGGLHPVIERALCAELSKDSGGYTLRIFAEPMACADIYMVLNGLRAEDGKIKFSGAGIYHGRIELEGEIDGDSIKASGLMGNVVVNIDFKRREWNFPSMGMKAPKGAKVLFDGKDTSAWAMNDGGGEINWKVLDGGSMLVANNARNSEGRHINSTIRTREKFKGPFQMHLEFKIHEMPDADRYARGNSGIFIGPYEIQILDSFGNEVRWNGCGALYRQVPPQVNASIEPDAWQTFDIAYYPAELKDGKQVKPATFTIYHNGRRIHKDSEVWWGTALPESQRPNFTPPAEVEIELQDHNDAVEFRNIWLKPLK